MASISISHQQANDSGPAIPPPIPNRPVSRLNSNNDSSRFCNGRNGPSPSTNVGNDSLQTATAARIISIGKDNRSSSSSDETSNGSDHESDQSAASSYTTQNTSGNADNEGSKSATGRSGSNWSVNVTVPLGNATSKGTPATSSTSDKAEKVVNQQLESLYAQMNSRSKAQTPETGTASSVRKDDWLGTGNAGQHSDTEPAETSYDDGRDTAAASYIPKSNNTNKKGNGGLASTLVNQGEKIHNRNLHQDRGNGEDNVTPSRSRPDLSRSSASQSGRAKRERADIQSPGRSTQNKNVTVEFKAAEQYNDQPDNYKGGAYDERHLANDRPVERRPYTTDRQEYSTKPRLQDDGPGYNNQERATASARHMQPPVLERQISYNRQDMVPERQHSYHKPQQAMARRSSYCDNDRGNANPDWNSGAVNRQEDCYDDVEYGGGHSGESTHWYRDLDEDDRNDHNQQRAYARGKNEAFAYERRDADGERPPDRGYASSRGDYSQRPPQPSFERTYSGNNVPSRGYESARYGESHAQQQSNRAPPARGGPQWDGYDRNEYSGSRTFAEDDRSQPSKQKSKTQLNFTTERKMDMA